MSELRKYFRCQRCGKCCEQIGLAWDPEAAQEIAEFLKISLDDLIECYYGRLSPDGKTWESQDDKRTPCQFLKSEGDKASCSIYPVMPLGCRLYPIKTDFGTSGIDCAAAKLAYGKWEEIHRSEQDNNEILGHFNLFKIAFDPNHLVGPIAFIELASHSINKIEGKDRKCLSPHCVNYQELKCKIDLLKQELDEIAEQGKTFFDEEFKRREKWRKRKRSKRLKEN